MGHLKAARRARGVPEVEHDGLALEGVEADGLALLEVLVAERLEAERRGDVRAALRRMSRSRMRRRG